MVVWGLWFWGWSFQLMGFGACGVGPSGFFGIGALYINIEEQLWEKNNASLVVKQHCVVYMIRIATSLLSFYNYLKAALEPWLQSIMFMRTAYFYQVPRIGLLSHFPYFMTLFVLLQGIVYLGKLLLIYHPDRMCHASCKVPAQDNLTSPSLIKVHPASEAGDVNSSEDKVKEEGLTSHSLREIADMMAEKNKTDEIKYQWCFIVAVIDRMTCIITVIICITLGIKLYGISVS